MKLSEKGLIGRTDKKGLWSVFSKDPFFKPLSLFFAAERLKL